jgi:hypothetical protein
VAELALTMVLAVVRRVFVYSPVVEFSKAEGELLERGTLVVDTRYICILCVLFTAYFPNPTMLS